MRIAVWNRVMIMLLVVLLALGPMSAGAESLTQISVEKTASEQLDENYQADVTLTVSGAKKRIINVVFVVDGTTIQDHHHQAITSGLRVMLDELTQNENITLNAGIIAFGNNAKTISELAVVNRENASGFQERMREIVLQNTERGTNIQSGVRAGKAMLSKAADGEKYMILITDGGGFYYFNQKNQSVSKAFSTGTGVYPLQQMDANGEVLGNSSLCLKCGSFAEFMSRYGKMVEDSVEPSFTIYELYLANWLSSVKKGALTKVQIDEMVRKGEYIQDIERADYFAAKELENIDFNFILIGFDYSEARRQTAPDITDTIGVSKSFMAWADTIGTYYDCTDLMPEDSELYENIVNNTKEDRTVGLDVNADMDQRLADVFTEISDEVAVAVEEDSYIIDYIGKGNKYTKDGLPYANEYDFDFVNEPEGMNLVVTGLGESTAYSARRKAENAYEMVDSKGNVGFELTYMPQSASVEEHFRLDFKRSLKAGERMSFTYKVELSKTGTKDWDLPGKYTDMDTNVKAELYPHGGKTMEFPKPKTSYENIEILLPQTGDNSCIWLWIALAAISISAALLIRNKMKWRQE